MKDHIYPDDLKRIPVPVISVREQEKLVALTDRLRDSAWELLDLSSSGVRYSRSVDAKVFVPALPTTMVVLAANKKIHAVDLAKAGATLFEMVPGHENAVLTGARAIGPDIFVRRQLVARVRSDVRDPELVANYFARIFSESNANFVTLKRRVTVPSTSEGVRAVMTAVSEIETRVRGLLSERQRLRDEIDEAVWKLFGGSPVTTTGRGKVIPMVGDLGEAIPAHAKRAPASSSTRRRAK